MLAKLKLFLERIDYYRDKALAPFIIKAWPRKVLPNHLTIIRFILAFTIIWLLFSGFKQKSWLVLIIIIGALTDLFDGSVARILKKETDFGIFMDPIADRFLILPIAIFSLAGHYLWLLFALIIPEIYNASLALYCKFEKIEIRVNIFGKAKMVLESFALTYIFIFDFPTRPSLLPITLLCMAFIFLLLDIVMKTKTAKFKNA